MATATTQAGPSNTTATLSVKEVAASVGTVREALQHVARAFYETKHVLLLDQLMRKEAMRDEELAGRLGVAIKDLTKIARLLMKEGLVSEYRRAEQKPGAMKKTDRVYYFVDYRHCVDVIKWRMWRLGKSLDEKQRNVLDGQGYVCPTCLKAYSTLDVLHLVATIEGFLCEICNTQLSDNDNAEEVQKNKDRMQRFNQQSGKIVKCLQKTDKVGLPSFVIADWVAANVPLEDTVDAADGLAVATGGTKEAPVTVQMAQEGDEALKRKLKEQEAEAKRQANALPVWIAQSTVSGQPVAGGSKAKRDDGRVQLPPSPAKEEKSKPSGEDADLEAYYASLESASAATGLVAPSLKRSPSAERTPYSRPGSVVSSTSTSNKRSREIDEGYGSIENLRELEGKGKKAKTSVESSPVDPVKEEEGEDENEGDFEEVKMVKVAGKMVSLDQITAEMESAMTPEEYTAYADAMMAA